MSIDDRSRLRPVERAVLRHVDAGTPASEIAWRFRRTPLYVNRVRELSQIPRRHRVAPTTTTSGLRPVERCVLRARREGADYPEIAARLRRTPRYVAKVEELANYKLRTRTDGR